MAYDEGAAERIREALGKKIAYSERKMFGGLAFMVRGNMCVGVIGESLMARVGPDQYREMLGRTSVREMDFTGKPMTGYVYVDPPGFEDDAALDEIVGRCLRFNSGLPAK